MNEVIFHEDDLVRVTSYRIRIGSEEFLTRWLVGYGLKRPFPWLALILLIQVILYIYFDWKSIKEGDRIYIPALLLLGAILAYLLNPRYLYLYFAEGFARRIKTRRSSYVTNIFRVLQELAVHLGENGQDKTT